MQSKLMKRVVSTEYLVGAILVAVFYISVGNFAWYWLPVLFVVFDLSAVGYVFNPRIGALLYNLGHSLIGPTLLVAIYIATTNQTVLFIALIWLFHILVDRALGYGLKHTAGFEHTHLGPIGKAKKK
jgi:phosphoglycerol transferase MdoB-like AlkP superfamily enzyme